MTAYVGIDPGTIKLGFCVLTDDRLMTSGTVKLNPRGASINDRIIAMTYSMRELFKNLKGIDVVHVGIEDQYVAKNARDTISLARLTGAIMFVCFDTLAVVPHFIQTSRISTLQHKRSDMTYQELAMQIAKKLYNVDCSTEDEAIAICIAEIVRRDVLGNELREPEQSST